MVPKVGLHSLEKNFMKMGNGLKKCKENLSNAE